MLSLTKFAAIARQYGVPFEVRFMAGYSFVWVGGTREEWTWPGGSNQFFDALKAAGAHMRSCDSGMSMQLESLT